MNAKRDATGHPIMNTRRNQTMAKRIPGHISAISVVVVLVVVVVLTVRPLLNDKRLLIL